MPVKALTTHLRQMAEELDAANIYVWDGNYYALEVTTRLELEDRGGMVRVGLGHYNQAPGIWARIPLGALGNAGGDQEVWGGNGEDGSRLYLMVWVSCTGGEH